MQQATADVMEYSGLSACLHGSVIHEFRGQIWTGQLHGNHRGASGESLRRQ
jgi:hypothetical protein